MIENEYYRILKVVESESVEVCYVFRDEYLLVIGNIFSEIELDLIFEFKFEKFLNKLSDNLVCGIVYYELELINDVDEVFVSEKVDDLILD